MAPRSTTPVPLLDISTLVTREHVRIDGTNYPLRSADELTYLFNRTLGGKFGRVGELLQRKRRSKAQEQEKHRLLDECCRAVLEAPPLVHKKLSDRHRMEIVAVFSLLLQARRKAAGATPVKAAVKAAAAPRNGHMVAMSTTSRTGAPSPRA